MREILLIPGVKEMIQTVIIGVVLVVLIVSLRMAFKKDDGDQ